MDKQHPYWQRLRHLVVPYLFALTLTVPVLALLRLTLDRFLPDLGIDQKVLELWIPIAVAAVLVVLLLRARVRVLSFADKQDNRRIVFLMLAWLGLMLPAILAQKYVLVAASTLHQIDRVQEIDPERPGRYYRIAEYNVFRQYASSYATVTRAGTGQRRMNFDFYFVIPLSFGEQSIDENHRYWYGITHHKEVSDSLSEEEKERLYKRAFEAGVGKVNKHDFSGQSYFEVLSPSADRTNFLKAVATRYGNEAASRSLVLLPRSGVFADRTGSQLWWIVGSVLAGLGLLCLYLLWPATDSAELGRQRRGQGPATLPARGYLAFFIPSERLFAAPITINAIILVFLVLLFAGVDPVNPAGSDLLKWGANRRSETTSGQWWRLVSSMFLHGGILHLALNIYGLMIAALFIEPLFGRYRFWLIYFLAGIAGSLASISWYENTISIGASGAIFGLFGAIFALALKGVLNMKALTSMWVFLGISLLFGLTGGIDNAAHLGGLAAGISLGLLLPLNVHVGREK